MSRRNRTAEYYVKHLASALAAEKEISLELAKALRLHMAIADGLRKQLENRTSLTGAGAGELPGTN